MNFIKSILVGSSIILGLKYLCRKKTRINNARRRLKNYIIIDYSNTWGGGAYITLFHRNNKYIHTMVGVYYYVQIFYLTPKYKIKSDSWSDKEFYNKLRQHCVLRNIQIYMNPSKNVDDSFIDYINYRTVNSNTITTYNQEDNWIEQTLYDLSYSKSYNVNLLYKDYICARYKNKCINGRIEVIATLKYSKSNWSDICESTTMYEREVIRLISEYI